MKKYILPVLCLVAVVALFVAAIYQWEHRSQATPQVSTAQALQQASDARKALAVHDAVNKVNLDNATKQVTDLTNQKTSLCAQLKTAKLVNALCQ